MNDIGIKQRPGERLTNAKRTVIIAKLFDQLSQGYYSTSELAKRTGLTRMVVNRYRELADELVSKKITNRNSIRNLQIQRTYNLVEQMMNDLKDCKTIKEKTAIYNSILKASSHLALITGLNVETHVNIDQQQLVIIRADKQGKNETQDLEAKSEPIVIKSQSDVQTAVLSQPKNNSDN